MHCGFMVQVQSLYHEATNFEFIACMPTFVTPPQAIQHTKVEESIGRRRLLHNLQMFLQLLCCEVPAFQWACICKTASLNGHVEQLPK